MERRASSPAEARADAPAAAGETPGLRLRSGKVLEVGCDASDFWIVSY